MELKIETPYVLIENIIPKEVYEAVEHSWIQLIPEETRKSVTARLDINEPSSEIILAGEFTPDGQLYDATVFKIEGDHISYEFRETPQKLIKGDFALRQTYESYQWHKDASPQKEEAAAQEIVPLTLSIDSHFSNPGQKTKIEKFVKEKIEPGLRIDFPTQSELSPEMRHRQPAGVPIQDDTNSEKTTRIRHILSNYKGQKSQTK